MWRINERELLLRYLAGDLSPREISKLDARLLSDDDLLDRLEEARNDLLDAYAAGELSQEQKERLEKLLHQSPMQRSRLSLARALHREHQAGTARTRTAAKSGFPWRIAVAVICVAIAVTAIVYLKSHPKNPLTSAQGERAPATQGARAKAAQPAGQVPARQPAFALLLGTGIERGAGSVRLVTLPHGLETIEVQILLPTQASIERYEIQVDFPRNSAMQTFSGLIPQEMSSQKLVQFDLPAAELPSGLYIFRLYRSGTAKNTPIASYQAVITHNSASSPK